MTSEQFTRFLDEAAAISDDVNEFVLLGRQLYALALSMLPPHEREARLEAIEDFGALRKIVELFPGASGVPGVPYGPLH